MNIIILGGAGFLGTNIAIKLASFYENRITIVDKNPNFFNRIKALGFANISYKVSCLDSNTFFDKLLQNQDVVYHLASTTIPSTSNKQIPFELESNVVVTANMLDSCVRCKIKKVVFISSGGTVYGKEGKCPLSENSLTNPITSYGLQKLAIEKLIYVYHYIYGIDYRIIRLSNPFGPYQNPLGQLGAVTTFTYKALKHEKIFVYGDGSVIRDFIFVDDFTKALSKIVNSDNSYKLFNVGSGKGTSIKTLLQIISNVLKVKLDIEYKPVRSVDVPINFLDISRYESIFGKLNITSLERGIKETADFLRDAYEI